MTNSMFLPFYYSSKGITLLSVETFGQPMRYFKTHQSPLLAAFWRGVDLSSASIASNIRTLDEVVLGERLAWTVTYCLVPLRAESYVQNQAAYNALSIASLDTIFQQNMPAEMMLGIMKVITSELSEAQVSA